MASRGVKWLSTTLVDRRTVRGSDQIPALETVKAIRDAGGEADANFSASVADFKAAEGMVEQAVDTFGRIDIVVNNAGNLRDVIFHKMTEDDWIQLSQFTLKVASTPRALRPRTFVNRSRVVLST